MTLVERIISWITGKPSATTAAPSVESGTPEKQAVAQPTINKSDIMVNTITLSSDMEKLYLIDNGRAIEFKITEDKGILVGTLNGQITVVTALHAPKEEMDVPLETGDDGGGIPIPAAPGISAAPILPGGNKVVVGTKGKQWTTFFNQDKKILALIGIGEIDVNISESEKFEPQVFAFSLENSVVQIRRRGGNIEMRSVRRF